MADSRERAWPQRSTSSRGIGSLPASLTDRTGRRLLDPRRGPADTRRGNEPPRFADHTRLGAADRRRHRNRSRLGSRRATIPEPPPSELLRNDRCAAHARVQRPSCGPPCWSATRRLPWASPRLCWSASRWVSRWVAGRASIAGSIRTCICCSCCQPRHSSRSCSSWRGLGLAARALVVCLFSLPVVTECSRAALRQVDPRLRDMARAFCATSCAGVAQRCSCQVPCQAS